MTRLASNTIRLILTFRSLRFARSVPLVIAVGVMLSVSTAAQAAALNDNLLAYWRMDETSGTVAVDSSGNGNDATFTGGASAGWSTTSVLGGAVDLDGSNDIFTVAGGIDILNQSFSMSYWSNRDDSDRREFVFGQGDNTTFGTFLQVGFFQDTYKFGFRGAAFDQDFNPLATAADTVNYHHWVTTFDVATSTVTTYLDGTSLGSKVFAGSLSANSGSPDFWIGQRDDGSPDLFEGLVDELAVWKRVLSSNDVEDLYNNGDGVDIIPEPTSMILSMVSIMGLALLRRRRKS